MNKLILAGVAALALAAPAAAQDMAVSSDGTVYVMTDAQQTAYDAWPPERRTIYMAWPADYQTYFWTLTPTQQNGWWLLTDDQRAKVHAMTPEQRVAAWTAIERQMAGAPSANASATATAATTAAASASTSGPRFVSNAVVQTTPADAAPPTGDLPICSPNQQDNCINAWEAGKRGPGVARPLNYWPGKPASEIPGKMPAEKPAN
jgi:hypothetical protein